MRKICVFTSTRADYGLLRPVMKRIGECPELRLQILASGSHLREEHGNTWREIVNDGFSIDVKAPILDDNTNAPLDICRAMAKALDAYGHALSRLRPDVLLLLGDRYETVCLGLAATVLGVPMAHIAGGELTLGAMDDSFRHCITKMSLLHFTETEQYRQRVIQMGESPERCYDVGSLGVENIRDMELLARDELNASLGFTLPDPYLLLTFHPETLLGQATLGQCRNLLSALDELPGYNILATKANADQFGSLINQELERWATRNSGRVFLRASLGQLRYLSAMRYAAAVVGNSSSGIVEAPSMNIPTLNIGNRQQGRAAAGSVLHCTDDKQSILKGLEKILSPSFRNILKNIVNPYEKLHTSSRIVAAIKKYDWQLQKEKHFFDIDSGGLR